MKKLFLLLIVFCLSPISWADWNIHWEDFSESEGVMLFTGGTTGTAFSSTPTTTPVITNVTTGNLQWLATIESTAAGVIITSNIITNAYDIFCLKVYDTSPGQNNYLNMYFSTDNATSWITGRLDKDGQYNGTVFSGINSDSIRTINNPNVTATTTNVCATFYYFSLSSSRWKQMMAQVETTRVSSGLVSKDSIVYGTTIKTTDVINAIKIMGTTTGGKYIFFGIKK
jgi:hypothetical protein